MLKEGLSKKEADDGDNDKKRLIFVVKNINFRKWENVFVIHQSPFSKVGQPWILGFAGNLVVFLREISWVGGRSPDPAQRGMGFEGGGLNLLSPSFSNAADALSTTVGKGEKG